MIESHKDVDQEYLRVMSRLLVHGAKKLFLFGVIIFLFWADFRVFQSDLGQVKYVLGQISIKDTSEI